VPTQHIEDDHRERIDVERLIEASFKNNISELSRTCKTIGVQKCMETRICEVITKDGSKSKSK